MGRMMGVERVLSRSKTKAAKNRIDKGVTGRNMVMGEKQGVKTRPQSWLTRYRS